MAPPVPPAPPLGLPFGAAFGYQSGAAPLMPYTGAPAPAPAFFGAPPPAPAPPAPAPPSHILRLGNMVTAADVADDAEFADLSADVADELKKYGALASLLIPRKGRFVGLIFVEFAAVASAVAAAGPLAAKTFAGKHVQVSFESPASLADARASDK